MSIPNNVANFDGQKPVIDPNDAVMLLIDHQSGLFQTVQDMPMTTLRSNPSKGRTTNGNCQDNSMNYRRPSILRQAQDQG